jgi:hypothetical protein
MEMVLTTRSESSSSCHALVNDGNLLAIESASAMAFDSPSYRDTALLELDIAFVLPSSSDLRGRRLCYVTPGGTSTTTDHSTRPQPSSYAYISVQIPPFERTTTPAKIAQSS